MRRTLLTAIAILSAFCLLTAGRAAWMISSSQCSPIETLRVLKGERTINDAEFISRIKLIKTSDGLELWSTPHGDTWTAHGDVCLPFLLAEQEHDIYEPEGHRVQPGDVVLD